jgi:hypothetical protein
VRGGTELLGALRCRDILASALVVASAFGVTASPADPEPGVLPGMPPPLVVDGDLTDLSEQMSLSDEQRVAIRRLLDTYWNDWKGIQQLEFATYAPRWSAVEAIPYRRPNQTEFEAFVGQYSRIEQGLTGLDQTLFAALEPILAPEQIGNLRAWRDARAREYFLADAVVSGWFPHSHPADLRAIVSACVTEPQATSAVLAGYDAQVFSILKKLRKSIQESRACWMQRTDGLPVADINPEAPPQEVFRHREQIAPWLECLGPARHAMTEYFEATNRAVRQMILLTPPEEGALIEVMYYAQEFGRDFEMCYSLECLLNQAKESPLVNNDDREALAILDERWSRESRPLMRKMLDGVISSRVRHVPHANLGIKPPNALVEREGMDCALRLEALRREIEPSIDSLLPDESRQEIRARVWTERVEPMRATRQSNAALIAKRLDPRGPVIPKPIESSVFERMGAVTGEPAPAEQVASAVETYRAQYEAVMKAIAIPARTTGRSGDGSTPGTPELLQQLDELDSGLFDALGHSWLAPRALSLSRLSRQLSLASSSQHASPLTFVGDPANICDILVETAVATHDRDAAVTVVCERAPTLITSVEQYRRALRDVYDAAAMRTKARWARPQAPGGPADWQAIADHQADCEQAFERAERDAKRWHKQLLSQLDDSRQAIEGVIATPTAQRVRLAFGCALFPGLMKSTTIAMSRIHRSLELTSLRPDQRVAITDWALSFDARAEEALSSAIQSLAVIAMSDEPGAPEVFYSLQLKQIAIDQRRIANDVELELRRLLDSAQLAEIGIIKND